MAMTPKEQIEIIAAYDAGEVIQYQPMWAEKWGSEDFCSPGYEFNFQNFRYRIKPKPLELWVIVTARGVVLNTAFTDILTAHACLKSSERVVHMSEVLGD